MRPIQNRLLHNFRNTRVSGGNEPVFLLIDLLEMKRFLCAKSKRPWGGRAAWSRRPRPPGVIVIIMGSGGEGWSGARTDFCSDCIVVFGVRADDYIAALVLTFQPRWDTRGKKKRSAAYSSSPDWLYFLVLASFHLPVWRSCHSCEDDWYLIRKHSSLPHWLRGCLFWGMIWATVLTLMHYAECMALFTAGEKQ